MVAARTPQTNVVVIGICLVIWLVSFLFFDRGHVGWWLILVFALLCVVALAKHAAADYVSGRVRRDVHK